jgi:ferredoxin-type protein NapF
MSRRGFLGGRLRSRGVGEFRPPWALGPDLFEARCTRCAQCVTVCPTAIIVRAAGGFPMVDFTRGECTFCGDCVRACEPGALVRGGDPAPPWGLRAVIGDRCLVAQGVECRVCGEACGADAIRFRLRPGGVAQPQLDAAQCTGCGACVGRCPVAAIGMTNVPERIG